MKPIRLPPSRRGIEIVGSDAAGVFYGIQTLRCLAPIEAYRKRKRGIDRGSKHCGCATFSLSRSAPGRRSQFSNAGTVKKLLD